MSEPVDTNVLLRYLMEDASSIPERFRGVFSFFRKLERGERTAFLPSLVVFQTYFVLTSYYEVPRPEAAQKLADLLGMRGLKVPDRRILRRCLSILRDGTTNLVDAYLAALCQSRGQAGVFSFDTGLEALGLELLPVE